MSGALERFLIARGERIVRVAPKHMAGARRSSRERGKSDSIDAFSVARAALKEGIEELPGAHLDGAALDIRLLVDHREDLIAARTSDQQRLRWHLHDLWPELEIPAGALDTAKWLGKASRRLARAAADHARADRARARAPDHRAAPAASASSRQSSPRSSRATRRSCSHERGCGPLTAAKLIGEIAGADRFAHRRKARPHRRQPRRSPPPRATPTATASTAAATASSTAPFTASPSTKPTGIPTPPPTSPANKPKASHAKKRSAASNATSPAASGNSSAPPPRIKTRARTTTPHINNTPPPHHRHRPHFMACTR